MPATETWSGLAGADGVAARLNCGSEVPGRFLGEEIVAVLFDFTFPSLGSLRTSTVPSVFLR